MNNLEEQGLTELKSSELKEIDGGKEVPFFWMDFAMNGAAWLLSPIGERT